MDAAALEQIAQDIAASFGTSRTFERLTARSPEFSIDDGYRVGHLVRDLRRARGERVVGRKIGGTNTATYHLSGATGPSWGFMYDTTVGELPDGLGAFALGAFPLTRIEPEIAFRIGRTPAPGMSEDDILGCIDQVTHGFEFVFSPYGDWKVPPPDAVAAFCLHQGFVAGPWRDVASDRDGWREMLKSFSITLRSSSGVERRGSGSNVLGSPVLALKAIVDELGQHPDRQPIAAGEIVTTGTITELMPVMAGENWTTEIAGAPLAGLSVQLV